MTSDKQNRTPGLRRRAREAALALLYQWDLGVPNLEQHIQHYFDSNTLPPKARIYADNLVRGVVEHQDAIDTNLSEVSTHWRIDRMNIIDRNVLRLAIYEIKFVDDVPRKVSINEAIEIGKLFGTEDSGSFINGILDRFQKPAENASDSTLDGS
ncbi:MAG: transcription antitermination factor NusB [Myxococcales bacterium]|nr:transcription antitermination factor NusB [Myxococcales bacterium]